MRASSCPAKEPRARAWILHAQVDVEVHKRLANSDTNTIFSEYIQEVFNTIAAYLAERLASLDLLTCSMPTTLSYGCDMSVVNMLGIYHGHRMVNERTILGIFKGDGGSAGHVLQYIEGKDVFGTPVMVVEAYRSNMKPWLIRSAAGSGMTRLAKFIYKRQQEHLP